MKKTLLLLCLAAWFGASEASAQCCPPGEYGISVIENAEAHLSPRARMALQALRPYTGAQAKSNGIPDELAERFCLKFRSGEWRASGLLLATSALSEADLAARGISIHSKAGDVWSYSVPVRQLDALAGVRGAGYIDLSRPVRSRLDEAVAETGAADVHAGTGLEAPVMGEGVLVGIIDVGFDPTHPAFYSADGARHRVERIWYQDQEGTPPDGYDFGAEYADEATVDAGTDNTTNSHGTHVAGIAAGSNYNAPDGRFTGVAPEANLIFGSMVGSETDVLDAANYMIAHAQSVDKPLVMNMSLGTHIGPHDGTSLLDRGFENLTRPGAIFVGAAGNEGSTTLHLGREFGEGDTLTTLVGMSKGETEPLAYTGLTEIDLWADAPFEVAVFAIDAETGEVLDGTDFLATDAGFAEATLTESEGVEIEIATETASPLNGKHHALVFLYSDAPVVVGLTVTAAEGANLHAWNNGLGDGAPFTSDYRPLDPEILPYLVSGDTEYTVGEIGGTSKAVVSVGAYTTTNTYADIDGEIIEIMEYADLGEIAPFSGRGPTADGRTKPEITAPGNVVVAAGSSYDEYIDWHYVDGVLVAEIEGQERTWPFLAFEGTSMSTPMVSGIIALMLAVKPDMDYDQAVGLLQSTARQDEWTGAIGAEGDQTWGWGKIDALAAVQAAAGTVSVDEAKTAWANSLSVYPNPAAGHIQLMFFGATSAEADVQLVNTTGQTVFAQKLNPVETARARLDVSELPSGTYALRVAQGGKTTFKKVILAR